MKASVSGIDLELDYLIKTRSDHVLMAAVCHSSALKVNSFLAFCGMENIHIRYEIYDTTNADYRTLKTKVGTGYSAFYYGIAIDKEVGNNYILSTEDNIEEDYYNYLMKNFNLPLLKEWKDYLFRESLRNGVVCCDANNSILIADDPEKKILIGENEIALNKINLYSVEISDNMLRMIVSDGLKSKKIWISLKEQQPVKATCLDEYMLQYGNSIGEHMERTHIRPKFYLKRDVDGLALLSKKLYAPQASCSNGVIATMKDPKDHFCFVVEEMGCGKTLQAIAAVEGYYNQKWLQEHPGKRLKDCFMSKEVAYRIAVMAPSHLTDKWQREIEEQIPYVKVTQVTELSQLVNLRKHRKERNGKEVYIFSKEFAKADTQKRPVPSHIGYRIPVANICLDCLKVSAENGNDFQRKLIKKKRAFHKNELLGLAIIPMKNINGLPTCVKCHRHHSHKMYLDDYGKYSGLICPNCDNLLIKESIRAVAGKVPEDEFSLLVLQPEDFYKKVKGNERCSCCNNSLWEDNVEPLDISIFGIKQKKKSNSKWGKIKFYSNYAAKQQGEMDKSAYALKGRELLCVAENGVGKEYIESKREYGPRRTPGARYCKKYLKGAFDVFIADEAHLYEGIRTEQNIAMHHLTKASKFTIPMTGTLSNGTASSFFALFFMLIPGEMKKAGYDYTSEGLMDFAKKYGVVETTYEYSGDDDYCYNAAGKGQQIASPKVKPGISPLIYSAFLVNHSVMLNIGDLSAHMPALNEHVFELDMPNAVSKGYYEVIEKIKKELKKRSDVGKGLIGKLIQFSLSYPDKPYGREPVYSKKVENQVVVDPQNLEEYEDVDTLLPKESKLIEIINKEISEGRNIFVYTEYSRKQETNISYKLLDIIEKHANLKGQVEVLDSKTIKPKDRDNYIRKNSDHIRVWITNYRNVETGVDFVGEYKGRKYNYPTIIFVQLGTSLCRVWQASRRSYRLNQTEECRNYYLCYKNTFQKDVLEMMGKKISAASAIQGNFSASALENMTGTEDPMVKLAKKVLNGDTDNSDVDVEELLTKTRKNIIADCDESIYVGNEPVLFYEVMGTAINIPFGNTSNKSTLGMSENILDLVDKESKKVEDKAYQTMLAFLMQEAQTSTVGQQKKSKPRRCNIAGQYYLF